MRILVLGPMHLQLIRYVHSYGDKAVSIEEQLDKDYIAHLNYYVTMELTRNFGVF